jgi:Fic family protein
VVTEEELDQIDKQYKPIPTFAEWEVIFRDTAAWTRRLAQLDELRGSADDHTFELAVRTSIRAAAFDTGAIEDLYQVSRGLTITVAKADPGWEAKVTEQSGEQALDLLEAQVRAYDLARELATSPHPITEERIRSIHEILTEPQETYEVTLPDRTREQRPFLLKGAYKEDPNHVVLADGKFHAFAPVGATTSAEMGKFVAELRTAEFAEAHPVVQAAYAHYCLVAIHPFCDGNGRVARALASTFTFRGARVPLLLFADERDAYLDTLAEADRGELSLFVRLIADATLASISVVAAELQAQKAPSPANVIGNVLSLLTAQGGLSHLEIDAVGVKLRNAFKAALDEAIGAANLSEGRFNAAANVSPVTRGKPLAGFRRPSNHSVTLRVTAGKPTPIKVDASFEVFVSRDPDELELFVIKSDAMGLEERFTLREVHEEMSVGAQIRMQALAKSALGEAVDAAARKATSAFHASDYSPQPRTDGAESDRGTSS